MALKEGCVAYQQGEIVPLIFKVYTESGIEFQVVPDESRERNVAYCDLMDEEGKHISFIPATLISDLPAEKQFICSWNTTNNSIGYYNLQVWATVNVSGKCDQAGNLIIEGRLASEVLLRYVRD